MLLSYNQLVNKVIGSGYIRNVVEENVNGSSIDIRLGEDLLVESHPEVRCPTCNRLQREQPDLNLKSRVDRGQRVICYSVEKDFDGEIKEGCGEAHTYADYFSPVDITKKQPLAMSQRSCAEGFILWPGEVILGQSLEEFYLPATITAEYRLKSTMGRSFLEHLHAGWCDPYWQGSVLTLELVNMSKYHPLLLKAGMKIGQMCFYQHDPVPYEQSYAVKGQYNFDKKVTAGKGLK